MSNIISLEQMKATQTSEGTVEIAGLGAVRLRGITTDELIGIQSTASNDNIDNALQMIVVGMVEPQLTHEDVVWLRKLPAGIVTRLAKEVSRLTGLTDEDLVAAKNALAPAASVASSIA